jgi:hypothetical protein
MIALRFDRRRHGSNSPNQSGSSRYATFPNRQDFEKAGRNRSEDLSMAISSEREWAERASAFLKHKLRESEVTYLELAKRLKKHGFKETEASVTNKLKRGTFPATWFLACLAALELDGVALEEI